MNEADKLLRTIFVEALEIADAQQRLDYLSQACGTDLTLRREVEELLEAQAAAGEFLRDRPGPAAAHSPVLNAIAASAEQATRTEKAGDWIGRYKLLEKLGEGGCGVVYRAEQTEPVRRQVALKVIKLGMDTRQVVARFGAERQTLALMDHPSIAKVFDAGATDTGRPFFVMELVRGVRITDYCNQHHLATTERLKLFIQVCQAVQHAHQKGIIHRDLKPSNILVTVNDGVAVPKVIDFGIAKATEGRLTGLTLATAFEQFLGTPAYMSPEQAELTSTDIDTRSDIYSLGVLLYELLTGTTPFDTKALLAAGLDELRRTIREKEPMRPSARLSTGLVAPSGKASKTVELKAAEETPSRRQFETKDLIKQVRGDLDWIVMKCLEKDRARRYETANGLAKDIQRHLNNEPVVACPPSRLYSIQKLVRRNKLPIIAGLLVVVSLIVGIAVSTSEATKARRAEHALERQLYVANMSLIQEAWAQNNTRRVRQLLEETASFEERGFEWYYWQKRTHLEQFTIIVKSPKLLSVAFSEDGKRILTGSFDERAVEQWEASSGKKLGTLKVRAHRSGNDIEAVSPNGRLSATAHMNGTATVRETSTGRELLRLSGHGSRLCSVAFSSDGKRLVTGSADQTAKVWNVTTGKELLTLKGHRGLIISTAFSPDGKLIATGSSDQTAKIWDATEGNELYSLRGHMDAVLAVAFSPDGQRIVTGSDDQTVKVWKTDKDSEWLTIQSAAGRISSAGFSPDGRRTVTISDAGSVDVWEVSTGRHLLCFTNNNATIISAIYSPDGQRILTGSAGTTAQLWEAATGREVLKLNSCGSVAAFAPDGKEIVGIRAQTQATVWDAASGKALRTLGENHGNDVRAVAVSAEQIVIAGDHGSGVLDRVKGTETSLVRDEHIESRKFMAMSPDGHDYDSAVAFSRDGQRIVTGGEDQTAKVWDASTGNEVLILRGHKGAISFVGFSPDGKRIVTGGEDGTARVWETTTGRELLSLAGHGAAVAFSPDGQRIITIDNEGKAYVWAIASKEQAAVWQKEEEPPWARTR